MAAGEAVPESWRGALEPVLATPAARKLGGFLKAEEAAGKLIYPPRGSRLAALALTPLDAVKAVILGQDPYHGPGQAHGLCFSVAPGVKVPPSLVNIYKELASDLGLAPPGHGNLRSLGAAGRVAAQQCADRRGMAAPDRTRTWAGRRSPMRRWRPWRPRRSLACSCCGATMPASQGAARSRPRQRPPSGADRAPPQPASRRIPAFSAAAISARPMRFWKRMGAARSIGSFRTRFRHHSPLGPWPRRHPELSRVSPGNRVSRRRILRQARNREGYAHDSLAAPLPYRCPGAVPPAPRRRSPSPSQRRSQRQCRRPRRRAHWPDLPLPIATAMALSMAITAATASIIRSSPLPRPTRRHGWPCAAANAVRARLATSAPA